MLPLRESGRRSFESIVTPTASVPTVGTAGGSGEVGTSKNPTKGAADPIGLVPSAVPVCVAVATSINI